MHSLELAISPCPNDTFAFEALLHGRIDSPFSLNTRFLDIAELNQLAFAGGADVVKVSCFAYSWLQPDWVFLPAGAALGRGVGPLLVARPGFDPQHIHRAKIAIPGASTTAHLLLHHYAPTALNRHNLRFDQIMPAVARGDYDLGVIIHESRFTYADHGLCALADLGTYWEEQAGLPIPLGGIVARRSLGDAMHQRLADAIARSIRFAWQNPALVMPFVAMHAQEMAPDVMQQHIRLYVNSFTEDMGTEGWRALQHLLLVAQDLRSQPALANLWAA